MILIDPGRIWQQRQQPSRPKAKQWKPFSPSPQRWEPFRCHYEVYGWVSKKEWEGYRHLLWTIQSYVFGFPLWTLNCFVEKKHVAIWSSQWPQRSWRPNMKESQMAKRMTSTNSNFDNLPSTYLFVDPAFPNLNLISQEGKLFPWKKPLFIIYYRPYTCS